MLHKRAACDGDRCKQQNETEYVVIIVCVADLPPNATSKTSDTSSIPSRGWLALWLLVMSVSRPSTAATQRFSPYPTPEKSAEGEEDDSQKASSADSTVRMVLCTHAMT